MTNASSSPLVLLADDSITTLSLVSARLQRTGYEVITVTRGDEAVALAGERRPQLAVLDLDMPGLGGIDVVRQLRADPTFHDLPIIMLTSHADPGHVQQALDAGANAYIVKPFSPQELAVRVDELLGRR